MTSHLKRFVVCAAVLAGAYFALLYAALHGLSMAREALVSLFVVFTVVLGSLESYFRKRDSQRAVRFSLPIAYTIVSASASALVACGWALAWKDDLALVAGLGVLSVAVIVTAGVAATRQRIKAFHKEELFP